jgi:hypothetical protein
VAPLRQIQHQFAEVVTQAAMGSAAMAATAVLAQCWHEPFPPDCASFRRLTSQTSADLHGLHWIAQPYAGFRASDGTANAVRYTPFQRSDP